MSVAPSPLHRLGIVMEPDLADPREAAGVLNPGVARGPDGQVSLLPRLVASGNYSRIGLARVLCDPGGTPTGVERLGVVLTPRATGVERLGVVLTPRAPYELNEQTGGAVEDPRVTPLDRHDPRRVLYRSARSVLEPHLAGEREGVVPEIVFPTGGDARPDGVLDVYYGMADSRIGVARLGCGAVAAPAPAQAA
jgi:predicted GH43/DUF377 family glycosyl hydrolase